MINFPLALPLYLLQGCLRNHCIKFGGKLTSLEPENDNFLQLSNWWPYCWWHHWGNPLNYDFFTHWLDCNINFPVILIQNCHNKRIIIPWPECIYIFCFLCCHAFPFVQDIFTWYDLLSNGKDLVPFHPNTGLTAGNINFILSLSGWNCCFHHYDTLLPSLHLLLSLLHTDGDIIYT